MMFIYGSVVLIIFIIDILVILEVINRFKLMGGVIMLIFMFIIIMMLRWIGLMFSVIVIGNIKGVMIIRRFDGFIN